MKVKPLFLVLATLIVGLRAYAEDQKAWEGYLVDRTCRASIEGDSNTLNFVREQTKECILMPSCRRAGYAIFTRGQWLNLDKKGNALAEKYWLTTKRSKAFYLQVEGTAKAGTIRTKTIGEIPELKVEKEKE